MENTKKLRDLLRAVAERGQYGHRRTPKDFFMTGTYCEYYWSACTDLMDYETWQKLSKFAARYRRFVNYYEEIFPEWEETKKVTYADNSTDSVQVSKKLGKIRRVQVEAPWGDACF